MKYAKDRFDDFPRALKRRGAHRAPRTWGSKLRSWIVAIVAFFLLVGIGVGVMWVIDNQVQFTADLGGQPAETTAAAQTPTPTPTPTPQATFDASISVSVLNGNGASGLATAGTDRLLTAGWQVPTSGDADNYNYATTSIVIPDEASRGAALGVQQALGIGEITVNPSVAAAGTIVVILGADAVSVLL